MYVIRACAVRIMRQANSEMFERKGKAEKDCRKLSRKLKDHERKSTEKMVHACEKIRKANKRDMEVAVSCATVGLENALKKRVRGAECLKRNVAEANVFVGDLCSYPIISQWANVVSLFP